MDTETLELLGLTPNEAKIYKALLELKNDPGRSTRIADNALRIYKEKCSNEVLVEELMGHIHSVLN